MVALGVIFAGTVALTWIATIMLVLVGTFAVATGHGTPKDAGRTLPACQTEDSSGCYWDADTMGNGTGHDVVTR